MLICNLPQLVDDRALDQSPQETKHPVSFSETVPLKEDADCQKPLHPSPARAFKTETDVSPESDISNAISKTEDKLHKMSLNISDVDQEVDVITAPSANENSKRDPDEHVITNKDDKVIEQEWPEGYL